MPINLRNVFLELRHRSGELRTVPVIGISSTRFQVRWGLAGVYEIAIRDGQLIGARQWSIIDLNEAQRLHRRLNDAEYEERAKALKDYKLPDFQRGPHD